MSSAAPPDAIQASSAGTGIKKKTKKRNKPKKHVDTSTKHDDGDGDGAADQQPSLSPSPRDDGDDDDDDDDKNNDLSAADEEPDTPVVSDKHPSYLQCTRSSSTAGASRSRLWTPEGPRGVAARRPREACRRPPVDPPTLLWTRASLLHVLYKTYVLCTSSTDLLSTAALPASHLRDQLSS